MRGEKGRREREGGGRERGERGEGREIIIQICQTQSVYRWMRENGR